MHSQPCDDRCTHTASRVYSISISQSINTVLAWYIIKLGTSRQTAQQRMPLNRSSNFDSIPCSLFSTFNFFGSGSNTSILSLPLLSELSACRLNSTALPALSAILVVYIWRTADWQNTSPSANHSARRLDLHAAFTRPVTACPSSHLSLSASLRDELIGQRVHWGHYQYSYMQVFLPRDAVLARICCRRVSVCDRRTYEVVGLLCVLSNGYVTDDLAEPITTKSPLISLHFGFAFHSFVVDELIGTSTLVHTVTLRIFFGFGIWGVWTSLSLSSLPCPPLLPSPFLPSPASTIPLPCLRSRHP